MPSIINNVVPGFMAPLRTSVFLKIDELYLRSQNVIINKSYIKQKELIEKYVLPYIKSFCLRRDETHSIG